MRALYCSLFVLVTFFLHTAAQSAKTFVRAGNIYFVQNNNKTIQLTSLGQDRSPVLSPDKKNIAFFRVGTEIIPEQCRDFSDTHSIYGKQIWIIDVELKKERLLVKTNFACDQPMEMVIAPHHLTFSLDSKTLYFLTYAWTTSNALHAINIVDAKQHYLLPANSLAIAVSEEYKGDLILNQHRYFIGSGSYDWYWLFTPEGKEIGPLGEKASIK